jgi:hypothetical protein
MSDYIVINSWLTVRAKGATPLPPVELPYLVDVPSGLANRWVCCTNTKDCQTWHNKVWINRESYYSWRADRWAWRVIPAVRQARAKLPTVDEPSQGSMTTAGLSKASTEMDAKWERGMKNWTEEEVADLLGR